MKKTLLMGQPHTKMVRQYGARFTIARYNLFNVNYRNTKKNVWKVYQINDKDARNMSLKSFWCLYC